MRQSLNGTLRSCGGLLELLGLAHVIFNNFWKISKAHLVQGGSARFSIILLVELEGS